MYDDVEFDTHVGIAHTRWATHGVPNEVNSHPQRSDENNGKYFCAYRSILSMPFTRQVIFNLDVLCTFLANSLILSVCQIE